MKSRNSLILALLSSILLFVGCSSNNTTTKNNVEQKKPTDNTKVSYIYQDDEQSKTLNKKGAVIAKISEVALGTALKKAIADGGLEHAIEFCNIEAINITDSLSKAEGVSIRRIAQKYRNPKNKPTDVESKIFKQYIMDYLSSVPLKSRLAVNHKGNPVYYKPIVTNNMCLSCHGTTGETMPLDLTTKITDLYPEDKAIDFKSGQPRGMWAITFKNVNVGNN